MLIFKGTPELETERLILRKITPGDVYDVFEYASDPHVTEYLTWDTHRSLEDAMEFIQYTLGRYDRDEAGEWGIVLKKTNRLIGSVGFASYDLRNNRAELGYVLSRRYWGQGIMPEAVKKILKFAFVVMGLNRVECCHLLPNEKSGRVMEKVGMRFEGIAREKIYAKGKYWDVKQYAILYSDWLRRMDI